MSLWDIFLATLWFMVLVTWIWLLITIFSDIFRDHELSGVNKALWCLLLIIFPWIGALAYLIVRGRSMNERARAQAERNQQAFSQYVRESAGVGTSTADELGKLADLRDRGTISAEEFQTAKAKLLGTEQAPTATAHPDGHTVASGT